jgi:hypothetical protein
MCINKNSFHFVYLKVAQKLNYPCYITIVLRCSFWIHVINENENCCGWEFPHQDV